MALRRIGELELETDVRFHQRMWRAQRIGWFCALAILMAAVAGVFGAGPLSEATARTEDGSLEVKCERYARKGARAEFRLDAAAQGESTVRIGLNHDALDALQIERITPMPGEVAEAGDALVYSFRMGPSSERAHIVFHTKLRAMGPLKARFSLPGGRTAECGMFVYP